MLEAKLLKLSTVLTFGIKPTQRQAKHEFFVLPLSTLAPDRLLAAMAMLLVVLSLASGFFHWRPRIGQVELRKQIDAWWIFLPAVSIAVCTYPVGPIVLSILIIGLGLRELLHQKVAPHIANPPTARSANNVYFMSALLVAGLSCISLFPTLGLGTHTSQSWLFYLFALTAINDICQFVLGTRFGRHKIAPRSSPNKTWEGLLGGVVGSSIFSVVLGLHLQLGSAVHLACLGFSLAIIGFFGDLAFSNTKRQLGIKDFSQMIPGHGGILDRVDSLVLTAPALYLWLTYWFYSPFRID